MANGRRGHASLGVSMNNNLKQLSLITCLPLLLLVGCLCFQSTQFGMIPQWFNTSSLSKIHRAKVEISFVLKPRMVSNSLRQQLLCRFKELLCEHSQFGLFVVSSTPRGMRPKRDRLKSSPLGGDYGARSQRSPQNRGFPTKMGERQRKARKTWERNCKRSVSRSNLGCSEAKLAM